MADDHATPESALERLIAGNMRFVTGKPKHPHNGPSRREEVVAGQKPFATVITCSDSRVPPEIIFDCGIGDIFVVRTAGHYLDETALGSVIYAVAHLACPVVMVLGHESCGALTTATNPSFEPASEPPVLRTLVKKLQDNIPNAMEADPADPGRLESAIRENVNSVSRQLSQLHAVRDRLGDGSLSVVTAMYSMETGNVTLF